MQRKTLLSAVGAAVLTVAAAGSALAVSFSAVDGGSPDKVGTFTPEATTTVTAPSGSTPSASVVTVVVDDRTPATVATTRATVPTSRATAPTTPATTRPAAGPAVTAATSPGTVTTTPSRSTTVTTVDDGPDDDRDDDRSDSGRSGSGRADDGDDDRDD
jgi:hypothetical protein